MNLERYSALKAGDHESPLLLCGLYVGDLVRKKAEGKGGDIHFVVEE